MILLGINYVQLHGFEKNDSTFVKANVDYHVDRNQYFV